jgi:MFS family permease
MWFQTLGQSVLVYRLTESELYLGLVNFAQFFGVLLLSPWGGSAADRFDRRRVLIAAQISCAAPTAVLALLTAVDAITAELVVALVLLAGLSYGFSTPAMHALIPSLVPRDSLAVAIALNSTTYNLARAAGPVAGAVVIHELGIAWAFGINAASYLALVVGLLLVTPAPVERPAERPRFRDTLGLLRRRPLLAALLAVSATAAVASDPVATLAPAFAEQVLDVSDVVGGYLLGAFGLGAVLAAVVVAGRVGTRAALAVRLAALGVGIAGFGLAPSIAVALPFLGLAGAAFLSSNAAATTRLQLEVEEEHRGRVMALWGIAFIGTRPLASLVDGVLAAAIGLRTTIVLFGALALVAAAAMSSRALRRSAR